MNIILRGDEIPDDLKEFFVPLNDAAKKSVFYVATQPYKGSHFAVFPPELIRPCIRAGSRANGIVLDPFNGSGTTGQVAIEEGRQYMGIELNPEYITLTNKRLSAVTPPLFAVHGQVEATKDVAMQLPSQETLSL